MIVEDWRSGGFGLYVHWPFCEAKCPYCDFNSHVAPFVDQGRWSQALVSEVRRVSALTSGRVLNSIFFGGGTPSLMHPDTVKAVLDAASESWIWANDIEITLEANPRSVEAARFRGFSDAGVNRVSLGVQSLREADLRRLGRLHDVSEARRALGVARDTFERVSFDLIYARQDQTLAGWEEELSEAISMDPDHLSLYQLTIEPGTAFWQRAQTGGLRGLPDEDLAAEMYERTQVLCADAGLVAYEVSNHAKPGAESRHNLIYWRGGDYAGVGPGAHGRLTLDGARQATAGWLTPGRWLSAAEAGCGDEFTDILTPQDHVGEYIMMSLRTTEGLDLVRARALWPNALPESAVTDLEGLGLLRRDSDRISATESGRLVLNAVIRALLPDATPA